MTQNLQSERVPTAFVFQYVYEILAYFLDIYLPMANFKASFKYWGLEIPIWNCIRTDILTEFPEYYIVIYYDKFLQNTIQKTNNNWTFC